MGRCGWWHATGPSHEIYISYINLSPTWHLSLEMVVDLVMPGHDMYARKRYCIKRDVLDHATKRLRLTFMTSIAKSFRVAMPMAI